MSFLHASLFSSLDVGIQAIAKRLSPNVGIGLNARLKSHRAVFCEDARERHTRFLLYHAEQTTARVDWPDTEDCMLGEPKANEWNLLKDQFDALVHSETEHEDNIEEFLDDQIRRRFGEWIARATEQNRKTGNDA